MNYKGLQFDYKGKFGVHDTKEGYSYYTGANDWYFAGYQESNIEKKIQFYSQSIKFNEKYIDLAYWRRSDALISAGEYKLALEDAEGFLKVVNE